MRNRDPMVPMDPEEYLEELEALGPKPTEIEYEVEPRTILGSHHDPNVIERSLELLKRWGRYKEGDSVKVESSDVEPDIIIGENKYEIETGMGPTRYGRTLYNITHVIKQSMKFLEMSSRGNTYYLFVDGRPHQSLENFLREIGAVEVLGTEGMLWKLPKLNEETISRYFRYLTGIEEEDVYQMVKHLEQMVNEINTLNLPRSKSYKGCLKTLLNLIKYFIRLRKMATDW